MQTTNIRQHVTNLLNNCYKLDLPASEINNMVEKELRTVISSVERARLPLSRVLGAMSAIDKTSNCFLPYSEQYSEMIAYWFSKTEDYVHVAVFLDSLKIRDCRDFRTLRQKMLELSNEIDATRTLTTFESFVGSFGLKKSIFENKIRNLSI